MQGRVPIVQVTDGSGGSNGNEGGPPGHESGPPHHPTLRPTHLFPKEGETECKSTERKKLSLTRKESFQCLV